MIDYEVNVTVESRDDGWHWFTMDLLHTGGPYPTKRLTWIAALDAGFKYREPEETWTVLKAQAQRIGKA